MIPEPNTQSWLDWRKNKIGASDAAAILGISLWSTPYELWQEKVGLKASKPQNSAMLRGIQMEEEARKSYERLTGEIVFPQVVIHPSYQWCIASLDGITLNGDKIVEIKCPNKDVMDMARRGEIPPYYYSQLQHQMMVTRLKNADYFCFDGERSFLVSIEKDEAYCENLLEKEKEFYLCMVNLTPPGITEEDYMDMSSDFEFKYLEEEYIHICEKLKEYESRKEDNRKLILEHCEGKNCFGSNIRVTKKVAKGRIEYDKIECLKEIDLDMYRKPSSTSYMITYNLEKQ